MSLRIRAAILVLTAAAYANSLYGVFLFDDIQIYRNPTIRSLSAALTSAWDEYPRAYRRRPVVNFTFAVNYAISGLKPWSYHLVNIAIHMASALLVYDLLRRTITGGTESRLTRSAETVSGAVALLWAVHPLQTQSVTYVTQRCESLMALMFLLMLYALARGASSSRPVRWYVLSVLACWLGIGCKEVMVVAPVVALLFDRIYLAGDWKELCRKRGFVYLGFILSYSWLASMIARTNFDRMSREIAAGRSATAWEYLMTQPGVLLHYLRLSFWPAGLVLRYEWPVVKELSDAVLPGLVIVVLLTLTVWSLIKAPRIGFVAASFFIVLAPTSSIMPIRHPAFEHRMYLPLLSVLILAVLMVWWSAHRWVTISRKGQCALIALLAVVLAIGTHIRNQDYYSSQSMWADILSKQPHNSWAMCEVAMDSLESGKPEKALTLAANAVQHAPQLPKAHSTLGTILAETGNFEAAIASHSNALQLVPNDGDALLGLAVAYEQSGRWDEAVKAFDEALKYCTATDWVLINYAAALAARGKLSTAEQCVRNAIEFNPANGAAYNNLGSIIMMRGGQLDDAIGCFRSAVSFSPLDVRAQENLRRALHIKQTQSAG
ncbi:MAG: tetratricopeptide repeat protein [Planctomycetota bacterium]